jgi:putative addiction module killer protein
MPTVCRTDKFDKYLKGLRDVRAKAKILVRLQRLEAGNPGDVKPAGEGISEMRIDHGPGYRIYYKLTGDIATVLTAGSKDSQGKDIQEAKQLASELEE